MEGDYYTMSFADELNSKADEYYRSQAKKPDISEFLADRVNQYVNDIETLCTNQAERGGHGIKGFFAPRKTDFSYETTTDGPFIIDLPKSNMHKKPRVNRFGELEGGSMEVKRAAITLYDGHNSKLWREIIEKNGVKIDNQMLENVRADLLKALSGLGFKKMEIEHLVGPKYEKKDGFGGYKAVNTGTYHYLYIVIEW